MTKLSTLAGDSKPIRTAQYTTGTDTFIPLAPNSWCRVTLVGAGNGGQSAQLDENFNTVGGGGGDAGATCVHWVRVAGATNVVVGAGGAVEGGIGGVSSFGAISSPVSVRLTTYTTRPSGYLSASTIAAIGHGFVAIRPAAVLGTGTGNFYGSVAGPGQVPTGFGSGGGGGGDNGSNPLPASAGAGGLVLIEEFGP